MAGALGSGYSGTALEKKLGIKENFRIRLIHAPENYFEFFAEWPENIEISDNPRKKKNLIHFFTKEFFGVPSFVAVTKKRNRTKRNDMGFLAKKVFENIIRCIGRFNQELCFGNRSGRYKGLFSE